MSQIEPDYIYQADMGFTRSELLKGLTNAVVPYAITNIHADPVEITEQDRLVKLTTGADGFRAIASMRIPVLPVQLAFFNFSESDYEQFMQRFRKYLHKGGG